MSFSIIVATDEVGGIGRNGSLPWMISDDMAYFKKITQKNGKNAVIMGRKTWDSIPEKFRPLSHRRNVIISRNLNLNLPSATKLTNTLDKALAISRDCEQTFVIGGGTIYQEAIQHPDCKTCYLTSISGNFSCDTFFSLDKSTWELKSQSPTREEKGIVFSFCIYQRKKMGHRKSDNPSIWLPDRDLNPE